MKQNYFHRRYYMVSFAVASVLLLVALARLPYAYYILLRFAVCMVNVIFAYYIYFENKVGFVWVSAIIAALYNPFFPIYLTRDIWRVLNLLTVVYFIVAICMVEYLQNMSRISTRIPR